MSELNTKRLHEFMEKFKSKAPAPQKTPLTKGGLIEYLRSDKGKERLKKAQEEYRKKHPKQ